MKSSLIIGILKVFLLLTIGSLSVIFLLPKNPTNQIFVPQGEIDATRYGFNLRMSSGEQFFFGFPLNDFYYHGFSKNHLLDKVTESRGGNIWEELSKILKEVFLNEKSAKLTLKGSNHDGNGEIDYEIKYSGGKIEIEKKISLDKNFDAIGETITICPDCFVTDDKNRIYLNRGSLTQNLIDFATKMNLTPLVIGEDQFFPVATSKIIILNHDGKVKIQIPTYSNEQISLRGGWNLLEIRIPVRSAKSVKIRQIIYL